MLNLVGLPYSQQNTESYFVLGKSKEVFVVNTYTNSGTVDQIISSGFIQSKTKNTVFAVAANNNQLIANAFVVDRFKNVTIANSYSNSGTSDQIVSSSFSLNRTAVVTAISSVINQQTHTTYFKVDRVNGFVVVNVVNSSQSANSDFLLNLSKDSEFSSAYTNGGSSWSVPTLLFNEVEPIIKMSLTFDQLGRPLVFYNTEDGLLKLYWYNPVTQTNEVKSMGIGYDPVACFDWPQDTGQPFSDMLVFYVNYTCETFV